MQKGISKQAGRSELFAKSRAGLNQLASHHASMCRLLLCGIVSPVEISRLKIRGEDTHV
jgi:hypothetical protein